MSGRLISRPDHPWRLPWGLVLDRTGGGLFRLCEARRVAVPAGGWIGRLQTSTGYCSSELVHVGHHSSTMNELLCRQP